MNVKQEHDWWRQVSCWSFEFKARKGNEIIRQDPLKLLEWWCKFLLKKLKMVYIRGGAKPFCFHMSMQKVGTLKPKGLIGISHALSLSLSFSPYRKRCSNYLLAFLAIITSWVKMNAVLRFGTHSILPSQTYIVPPPTPIYDIVIPKLLGN